MKKILVTILAACLILNTGNIAFATDQTISSANGNATTNVQLTAAATTFSVTIPTSISISIANDNTVTCPAPTVFKIVNGSPGRIKVTDVKMQNGIWKLKAYTDKATFDEYKVNSNYLGVQLSVGTAGNGNNTISTDDSDYSTSKQLADFDGAKEGWFAKAANNGNTDEIPITMAAFASPRADAIEKAVTAASITFTVAWDTVPAS